MAADPVFGYWGCDVPRPLTQSPKENRRQLFADAGVSKDNRW
jgi:hypothetical protein